MKYFTTFIIPILLCISCDSIEISSMSAGELENLISSSGFTESDVTESSVSQLDPEAALFLSLKAASLGYENAALLLARHSWKNSTGLFREKAAALYVGTAYDMNLWADAGFAASLAAAEYPEIYYFRRMAAASAYWQQKDSGLREEISELQNMPEGSDDFELYLFSAVSAFRTENNAWENDWILMFENVPFSDFIRRGWDYLSASVEDPISFFTGYEDLIEGKYLASSGEHGEALTRLSSWLEDHVSADPDVRFEMVISEDLEKLFINQGSSAKGGEFFEKIAAAAKEEKLSGAYLFTAARLYRRAGWYGNAARCLDRLLESAGDDAPDRLLWYSLDVALKTDPAAAARRLGKYASLWDDAGYFSDVLDNLCTGLVRERAWKEIASAADLLDISGPPDISDRYTYIARRAEEEGLLSSDEAAPEDKHRVYSDIYYRILTGDPLPELSTSPEAPIDSPSLPQMKQAELYISGLIRWGMDDLVLDAVREYREQLSETFLIYCAQQAVGRLEYLDSIRMMYQYQGRLSSIGLKSLYPDVYRGEVETAAELNDIPPQLLFALVWKESGFEREIVSRSGAIGLCQLMPSTAEDVAGRMNMKIPDLTNPAENLLTGSWYLNWLTGYVGNNSAAVISYNGGPGRVKRWMREYSDLSPDLLYEAVPVMETHQYGKKVLTAAVLYGMFYYNIKPAETLEIFFPG